MLGPLPYRLFVNPRFSSRRIASLPEAGFQRAKAQITAWDGYEITPLRDLPGVAQQADLGAIRLKDEATRFGLGSFKALGGAYGVACVLATALAQRGFPSEGLSAELAKGSYRDVTKGVTVTCATDGNHGRAVAWGAQRFHCGCVIFVHSSVSQERVDAIARYGAEVRRVPGTYDDAVREAARQAAANGWFIVSDTSWSGYSEVPQQIMQGYRLMADEAADQWRGERPTHVFVQAGVGGVAAAVSVQMRARFQPAPELPAPQVIVVEPDRAACLLASAEFGQPIAVPGNLDTLMAGLACGEPSPVAWQELNHGAAAFMAIPDEAAVACMRLLAAGGVVGGESGVAGLAGCLLAASDPASRELLGLDRSSRVLTFITEGATDPEVYRRLVGHLPEPIGRAGLFRA
ncbi:MAG: diaminopropionate ammonia-lyase [Acetobacteraceae bacterium]|jgi:diaminopropionate ammonia-lyase